MSILPVARIGDKTIGVCLIHGPQSGRILTGKAQTIVNAPPDSTIGDTVIANCGHTGKIITGNMQAFDTAPPTARLSDIFIGIYIGMIIQGSPDTFA